MGKNKTISLGSEGVSLEDDVERKSSLLIQLLVVGSFAIVVLIGNGIYQEYDKANLSKAVKMMGQFEAKELAGYIKKEVDEKDLIGAWQEVEKQHGKRKETFYVRLKLARTLRERKQLNMAAMVLENGIKNISFSKKNVGAFLMGHDLSVIYEEQEHYDQAIALIKKLLESKAGHLDAKLTLDLARIYLAKGDRSKAKEKLDYLLSSFPEDRVITPVGRAMVAVHFPATKATN